MRGATSKQAKSRSVQKQAHPVKRIHFTDVKPLRQFLMILSKFLFKRFQKWAQRRGPSLFNQRKSKYLQQFWFTRSTKGLSSRQRILSNFQAKYLCSMGTLPSRDPARTAKHKDLIFTFFCNKGNSKSLGQNWQKVLRLVPKQKNKKINLKSQLKCCEFLKVHGQLANLVFKWILLSSGS